jgi:hypothetical protein
MSHSNFLGFPRDSFTVHFHIKFLMQRSFHPNLAACPAHDNVLHFAAPTALGDLHKLGSFTCNIIHYIILYYIIQSKSLNSKFFHENTETCLTSHSCLNVADKLQYSRKEKHTIMYFECASLSKYNVFLFLVLQQLS